MKIYTAFYGKELPSGDVKTVRYRFFAYDNIDAMGKALAGYSEDGDCLPFRCLHDEDFNEVWMEGKP